MKEYFELNYLYMKMFYDRKIIPLGVDYKVVSVSPLKKYYEKHKGTPKILFKVLKMLPKFVEKEIWVKKWVVREVGELPRIYEEAEKEEEGRYYIFRWRK